jgi:succinoglycan biosynthesis protein ExoM
MRLPSDVAPIIVVVENGEAPGVRDHVRSVAELAPEPLAVVYASENELGIPQARNRSLTVALEHDPDWIGFIDDDETVDENWLERMVVAAREIEADVLQGPVRYVHANGEPQNTDLKKVKPKPRGMVLRTAYTNNTFVRSSLVRPDGLGLRFDESMRFTGGSDSDFFFRAADKGAVIKWVDDCWVQEVVIASRLTWRWQIQRALRVAVNAFVVHRKRHGLAAASRRYLPKALLRLLRGTATALLGALIWPIGAQTGRRLLLSGGKDAASGLGGLAGLGGFTPQPYMEVDGS